MLNKGREQERKAEKNEGKSKKEREERKVIEGEKSKRVGMSD